MHETTLCKPHVKWSEQKRAVCLVPVTEKRLPHSENEQRIVPPRGEDLSQGWPLRIAAKESYEDITMTDIIRKSGLSSSVVYMNYKNKEGIMLFSAEEMEIA